MILESKLMVDNPEIKENVLKAINLLQGIDGETFDFIIDALAFRDYVQPPIY
jgi:hypothetical protein